jgi:hypothetical protein
MNVDEETPMPSSVQNLLNARDDAMTNPRCQPLPSIRLYLSIPQTTIR